LGAGDSVFWVIKEGDPLFFLSTMPRQILKEEYYKIKQRSPSLITKKTLSYHPETTCFRGLKNEIKGSY